MPNPADLVLDPYTGLSHKSVLSGIGPSPVPAWVGKTNQRRLTAYLVLAAYMRNAARYFLKTDVTDPLRWEQHREYGDPAMLVTTIRSAVIGDEPRALVEGSDDELGPPPTAEDVTDKVISDGEPDTEGTPPAEGDTPDAATQAALAEATAEWQQRRGEVDAAMERQEWVDQWWTDERVGMKVVEAEDDAVGLGDGVYELVLSTDQQRPRLRIHEPGFYFPVWPSDAQGDDYPDTVHLAWQFEDDSGELFIRRITYERRRIVVFDDQGLPTGETATRTYPYASEPSEWMVVKTDATWRVKDLNQRKWGVNSLSLDRAAEIAMNEDGELILELDLGIDFIPVVHVPNTPAIKELWGESALTRIAQILDDLAAGDTDLAVSSALVASPALVMSGASGGADMITTYGPGMVFRTGDGNMSVLDTSSSLDALIKMQERLLERLSTVRQVPQSVLGRVDLNNQLAGITLLLSFGPFRSYIQNLRLPRVDKYALLLKFVQRMAIVGGWLDGPVLDANLSFGPFLPTDEQSVVTLIVSMVQAKILSRATAMRLAQEAGMDIESIEEELDAVRREDFEGALNLANATGSEQAAADYLGVTIEQPAAQNAPGSASGQPGGQPPAPGAEQPPPAPGEPPQPLP